MHCSCFLSREDRLNKDDLIIQIFTVTHYYNKYLSISAIIAL